MTLKLDQQGLIPAVVQDVGSKEVLMLGYISQGSLRRTMEGGSVEFYSRSREDLWHKGEMSGNFLHVKKAFQDCDGDTLLFQVEPDGPTCHTGNVSCFFTSLEESRPGVERPEKGSGILEELFAVIQQRKKEMPEGSYTTELLRAAQAAPGRRLWRRPANRRLPPLKTIPTKSPVKWQICCITAWYCLPPPVHHRKRSGRSSAPGGGRAG